MTFLKKVFGNKKTRLPSDEIIISDRDVSVSMSPTITNAQAVSSNSGSPKMTFHTSTNSSPSLNNITPPILNPSASQTVGDHQTTYQFDDFEITRTLGTGSFGRVCLARHRPTGQYYALKKLRKSDVVRLKQVEHTNNERQLLAKVDHPFLVKLVCTSQDTRHLYIILEFVCGGELFSLLRKVRVNLVVNFRSIS